MSLCVHGAFGIQRPLSGLEACSNAGAGGSLVGIKRRRMILLQSFRQEVL
jgi:hypothetical protein